MEPTGKFRAEGEKRVEHTEFAERVAILENQMKTALEGVGNFKRFQNDAAGKLGFVYGATWLAGVLAVVFLGLAGWGLNQAWMFMQSMEQLKEEFHQIHKSELPQKSLYTDSPTAYAVKKNETAIGWRE